jgi:hypothetical protein
MQLLSPSLYIYLSLSLSLSDWWTGCEHPLHRYLDVCGERKIERAGERERERERERQM